MRKIRSAGLILVGLLVVLPVAMGAAPAASAPDAPEAPSVLARAADAGAAAAAATGKAAAAAGSAVKGTVAALAEGVFALGSALGSLVGALAGLVASTALALAEGLAAVLRFALTLAVALLQGVVSLLLTAAGFAREHPRDVALVAAGAAGGAGIAGLAAWLKRHGLLTLVPLYSRLKSSEMLDHPQRKGVYEYIREHPGTHPSQIAEARGLGWGTIVYHLQRLEGAKLVAARKVGNQRCYFAVGGDLSRERQMATAALKGERAREVTEYVAANPGVSQKELAAGLGMSAALVSWHVKRLLASGVLSSERRGRSTALFARHTPGTPEAPAAVQAPTAQVA